MLSNMDSCLANSSYSSINQDRFTRLQATDIVKYMLSSGNYARNSSCFFKGEIAWDVVESVVIGMYPAVEAAWVETENTIPFGEALDLRANMGNNTTVFNAEGIIRELTHSHYNIVEVKADGLNLDFNLILSEILFSIS